MVTVNIPEWCRSSAWLLSSTAVTTAVGCRFVAGQSVFTWKWISKVEWRGMHTTLTGWREEKSSGGHWGVIHSQRGGTEVIAQRPIGSGCKHWRKWAKDFLKYAPFWYWEVFAGECPALGSYVVCIQGPLQYTPLVMLKRPQSSHAYHKRDANPHPFHITWPGNLELKSQN